MNTHNIPALLHTTSTDCSDGELRLVGDRRPIEGRVEICMDKTWGTVCGSTFDETDATLVCIQLGYSSLGLFITFYN